MKIVNALTSSGNIKNPDSPFTELFSLLKRYENLPTGIITLAYESCELKVINQHVDNAVMILIQGLQTLGYAISSASEKTTSVRYLNQIGMLIEVIANLTEALNDLKSDSELVLKERGVGNY